jgi:hypothetical protein
MGQIVDQHRLLDGAVYWLIARKASIKNEFEEVVSSPDLETEFHSRKAISNNSAVNLAFCKD